MDLSGIGDSDSKLPATNGSKIRTWRLLIKVCAGGKRTSVLVRSCSTLPDWGWHLPFRLGEVREGIRVRSASFFTFVSPPFFSLLALEHSDFFPKGYFSMVWSLTQEMCIFPGRRKSLWFTSGDHASCTNIKVLTSPGFRKQLSLCETILQLKGCICQCWHRNFFEHENKSWPREQDQTITWITKQEVTEIGQCMYFTVWTESSKYLSVLSFPLK